ncbi:hypothetical protein Tco_1458524 [Tanacetum coccineum]
MQISLTNVNAINAIYVSDGTFTSQPHRQEDEVQACLFETKQDLLLKVMLRLDVANGSFLNMVTEGGGVMLLSRGLRLIQHNPEYVFPTQESFVYSIVIPSTTTLAWKRGITLLSEAQVEVLTIEYDIMVPVTAMSQPLPPATLVDKSATALRVLNNQNALNRSLEPSDNQIDSDTLLGFLYDDGNPSSVITKTAMRLVSRAKAPPSPDYLSGPEHPPSPDYVPGPEHPPAPDYVPGPEYPKYLVPSADEVPIEDQPLPVDASPTALSPGYVADFDPSEEDPEGNPEEDPAEYLADRGDNDDDDGDEDNEEDEEEDEHLAPADSTTLSAIDPVPLAEDTEAFETDESAPTPPRSPRLRRAKIYITSPLLPLPSPPTHTSPTYDEAPLGYRAAMIRSRAASLLPLPAPSPYLFEVAESPSAAAARQTRHTLAHRVDYGFIVTMDASICTSESRVMTAVEEVSLLTRERRYFCLMASSYEREAADARRAWAHSESRSLAIEAQIRSLQRDVNVGSQDGPADVGSSC